MQTSTQPTPTARSTIAMPSTASPVFMRRSTWPFLAGGTRRRSDNMLATAKVVLAITARAFL